MTETTHVAVIGAGPAGLAVGACLRKAGLDFIILEREHQLAASWRRHYERLHLHTVKKYSSLPYLAFPRNYPRYVSRDLMIEYLETYAHEFGLRPRFCNAVRSVCREGSEWVVESATSSIRAPYVVIASGFNAEPSIPPIPGIGKFRGSVIHSVNYPNAKPFTGQDVLVVGMGNTGAEIALDLSEGGARPTISVRNGVHIVPRELFGIPIQIVAVLATKLLPMAVNDVLFPPILDIALGNVSKHGIERPPQGILHRNASSDKIPVIDVGTVREIIAGRIKIAPGISEITEDGVVFRTGETGRFDAIVLATGYSPNYQSYLKMGGGPPPDPKAGCRENKDPSLFFVGYRNVVTGLFREISKESARVADHIIRHRS